MWVRARPRGKGPKPGEGNCRCGRGRSSGEPGRVRLGRPIHLCSHLGCSMESTEGARVAMQTPLHHGSSRWEMPVAHSGNKLSASVQEMKMML